MWSHGRTPAVPALSNGLEWRFSCCGLGCLVSSLSYSPSPSRAADTARPARSRRRLPPPAAHPARLMRRHRSPVRSNANCRCFSHPTEACGARCSIEEVGTVQMSSPEGNNSRELIGELDSGFRTPPPATPRNGEGRKRSGSGLCLSPLSVSRRGYGSAAISLFEPPVTIHRLAICYPV